MSEIRATTISNAAGTGPITMTGQYAAKAWVNFNGTSTVAIRESGNVSSITDGGSGNYTVNFTAAMSDVNYVPAYGSGDTSLGGTWDYITGTYQTNISYIRVLTYARSTGANVDPLLVSATITR